MKTLSLLAPDFVTLDSIWRNPLPFVLWPVGHQGLIDHWVDEAVRQGAEEILIYAADRPAEIRRHLSAGGYWSRKAQVTAIRTEADAPSERSRWTGYRSRTARRSELWSLKASCPTGWRCSGSG